MSAMYQSEELARKRPAATATGVSKRLKVDTEERPSLMQLLSRKSALQPQHTQQINSRGTTTEQGDVMFELSMKRQVTVRKWNSMQFVDIREYYDDNGKAKPGKKGISLSPDQWKKLYNFSDAILEAIQLVEKDQVGMDSLTGVPGCILRPDGDVRAIALPLSNKRRVTVRYFRNGVLIDLREFYEQDGVLKPGKKGISLSKDQWTALQETADEINEALTAYNID